MRKIITWIKENKIFSTIGVGVVVELIVTQINRGKNKLVLINLIRIMWNTIFKFVSTILKFNIPVWIIFLIVFLVYIALKIIIRIEECRNSDNNWYREYTEEYYKGVLYNWSYYIDFEGKLDLKNFTPICIYCRGNLTKTSHYGNSHYMIPKLYCPNCNKVLKTPPSEELNEAMLYVRNKLKKKLEEKIEKNKTNSR